MIDLTPQQTEGMKEAYGKFQDIINAKSQRYLPCRENSTAMIQCFYDQYGDQYGEFVGNIAAWVNIWAGAQAEGLLKEPPTEAEIAAAKDQKERERIKRLRERDEAPGKNKSEDVQKKMEDEATERQNIATLALFAMQLKAKTGEEYLRCKENWESWVKCFTKPSGEKELFNVADMFRFWSKHSQMFKKSTPVEALNLATCKRDLLACSEPQHAKDFMKRYGQSGLIHEARRAVGADPAENAEILEKFDALLAQSSLTVYKSKLDRERKTAEEFAS
jgi:hypothetical protein